MRFSLQFCQRAGAICTSVHTVALLIFSPSDELGANNPIAIYMGSYVSDFLKISNCIISLILMGEYGFMEEINVHRVSCPELVNEKMSPSISQPASVLHPPVHSENIK
jgi:hypothetical protein